MKVIMWWARFDVITSLLLFSACRVVVNIRNVV